jgi:hypothetical protein
MNTGAPVLGAIGGYGTDLHPPMSHWFDPCGPVELAMRTDRFSALRAGWPSKATGAARASGRRSGW